MASSVQAFTYARVVSTDFHWVLAGADHVVLPAAISVLPMAHMLTHPAGGDGQWNLNEQLAQIDVQIEELAIPPGSPLIGRNIGDVEVHGKGTFIVVTLCRDDGTTTIHPEQNMVLAEGDAVIVVGHRGDIPSLPSTMPSDAR